MNQTKHFHPFYKGGILLAILIVSFLLLGRGAPAFADSPTVNGTITAGSLSETASGPYTFTGTPGTTATFTMPFSVSDTTGGAAGWNVTITSTQFKDGAGAGPHSLPITASTITGTTGVCTAGGAAGVNCIQAPLTNTVVTSVPLPTGTAVKFFGIAAAAASGVYTITPTISVVIPAITFLATYTSTVTLLLVSGP